MQTAARPRQRCRLHSNCGTAAVVGTRAFEIVLGQSRLAVEVLAHHFPHLWICGTGACQLSVVPVATTCVQGHAVDPHVLRRRSAADVRRASRTF